MNASSILLGLLGDSIGTSRSPAMHEAEGRAHGVSTVYRRLDTATPALTGRSLHEVLQLAQAMGFNGLNVTHPHKQAVVTMLDEVEEAAARIGAVNTVLIGADGRLSGHNTDVSGFHHSFVTGLPGVARGSVVQIGTGGAGSAVAHALVASGVERLRVADLDRDRATTLARSVNEAVGREVVSGVDSTGIETLIAQADGVVNATPMGMSAHPGTPFNTSCLTPRHWVVDVVYMPINTQLLVEARAKGCQTLNGGHMCVQQAVDAFRLFTGLEPDPARMHQTFMAAGTSLPAPPDPISTG